MKISIKNLKSIRIDGEFIKLDSCLKLCSLASTGGEAKIYIQNGDVFVNGEICTQRGKKIRPGDFIRFNGQIFRVYRKKMSGESENVNKESKS